MLENLAVMEGVKDFGSTECTLTFINADRSFHAAFVRTLGNPPIMEFFGSLCRNNSGAALHRGKMLRSEDWLTRNKEEHPAIVEASKIHCQASTLRILKAHLK